ncbi:MAG: hypothetical protein JNJ77_15820 [Planctomycetia bacterium]|nr:hypothetical protein [Planctomycetia bacterium]
MRITAVLTVCFALLGVILAGCQHYGPRSITADRIPYNQAIAESWKEQTLLNIVKLRYMDTPFFVDVPQITSGYTIQGTASAAGGIFPPVNPVSTFAQQLGLTANLQGAYQDRPTISYQPQTGSQFIRNLTTPINPGSVLYLLQSGYPADLVLNLTVDSINGIKNRSVVGGQIRPADPEFVQIVQSLRKGQQSGHVGIRVERAKDKPDSVAFFFQEQGIDPEIKAELAEVRRIMRLDPQAKSFPVVFGANASQPNEIAILSRSVYRILSELGTFVEVPEDHVTSGIAPYLGSAGTDGQPLLRVISSTCKPVNPFISVCYEGHWFWIDKTDSYSKRTIAYLVVLLALADTGAKENLPVITIQAN